MSIRSSRTDSTWTTTWWTCCGITWRSPTKSSSTKACPTDGTYEAIRDLDPKIQVFRSNWDGHAGLNWVNRFKDEARRRCTGDWCVLLDADEFIPEWEFGPLRERMARTDRNLLGMSLINFYGNYRVYNAFPEKFRMPFLKMNIHRNLPDIEMHGGDASSVRQTGHEFVLTADDAVCALHHFGAVRRAARLREQWRDMRGRLYNAPEPQAAAAIVHFRSAPTQLEGSGFPAVPEALRGTVVPGGA